MTSSVLFAEGKPLALGKLIGKGGEGEVFALSDDESLAVKRYTINDLGSRKAKVGAMINARLAHKSALVAFPLSVVTDHNGKFAGFIMKLVSGHKPIHELYSPSGRKHNFPECDYRFLVRSASNVARAVAQVHQQNCVIGDINHSGILISGKATAALIDADSFQIISGGDQHLCKVGVPDYTPPELQGQKLAGIVRTSNHDAFGLAIVAFQMLFMGRHPFVGRYAYGEMPIEKAISEFRFAYSERRQVGMTAPPATCGLSDFPLEIGAAFEAAFSLEQAHLRPSAEHWVRILSNLEKRLRRCDDVDFHYHPPEAQSCPWCRMERQLGITLFLPPIPGGSQASRADAGHGFNLESFWKAIQVVEFPTASDFEPVVPEMTVWPSGDAEHAQSAHAAQRLKGVGAGIASIAVLIGAPTYFFVWLPLGWYGIAKVAGKTALLPEYQNKLSAAERNWQQAVSGREQRSGLEALRSKKSELASARKELESLPAEKQRRIVHYQANRRSVQLHDFLDRHEIRKATIKGIGPAKEAALASYGIETAADLTLEKVLRISGFGPATARPLMDWRRIVEARFVYDDRVNASDNIALKRIEAEVGSRRGHLENLIRRGATELRSGAHAVRARLQAVDPVVIGAYERLLQAETDLAHVQSAGFNVSGLKQVGLWFVGLLFLAVIIIVIAKQSSITPVESGTGVPEAKQNGAEKIAITKFEAPRTYKVTSKSVNVRSGPGQEQAVLSQLPQGAIVRGLGETLAGDGSKWIAVNLPGGRQGFVAERLLSLVQPSAAVSESEGETCADDLSWDELLICQDAGLAAKAAEYQRLDEALRGTPQLAARASSIASAEGWLERRASCEASADQRSCLSSLLDERVQALNVLLATNVSPVENASPVEAPTGNEPVGPDGDADAAPESVTDPLDFQFTEPLGDNEIDPPDAS